jgi:8-oxo-dGTP diphosphatase
MEIRDLYDEFRNKTNETIIKGETVPKGRYYITVVVWIENNNGKFLIQQRSISKSSKWATTGGHPTAGESSEQGVISEIKEELGLNADINKLVLIKTIKTEDDFVDIYYLKEDYDINDIVLQEEEVQAVKWANKDEIEAMIDGSLFSKSHTEFYNYLIDYFKK